MLRSFIKFIITLAIIAGIAFGAFWGVTTAIETHSFVAIDVNSDADDYFLLEITSGMRAGEVIDILYDEGLVRNSMIADLLVRFNRWGNIRMGVYRVHTGMSLEEMFIVFQEGTVVQEEFIHIFIPEGFLITGIAERLSDVFALSQQEWLELWADEEFLHELIEEYWFLTDAILNPSLLFPLEGYFYPIRQDIPADMTDAREITRVILNMSTHMLDPVRLEIEEHELSIHQILSFAAIIEGETQRVDQKNDVAGVFYNRLGRGEPWGSDVSSQYLLEERVEQVLYEHTLVDSPFNTYIHPGIPIGPMNSPSVASIRAAMNPSDHNYLFFITNMFGCVGELGEKIFATTFEQHQANTATYLNPAYNNNGVCP